MTQGTLSHPKGGWQQEEIDLLFSAVQQASENGIPLRDVFADVGERLSRKPNSIRNFYYARIRETPQLSPRQTAFRSFTPDELHALLREVLIARGQGESVRACVIRLSGGDRSRMLRLQNKYRSVLKNKPELLTQVAMELRAEGLPCPENVTGCRRYSHPSAVPDVLSQLAPHMNDPQVRAMTEGLLSLLDRRKSAEAEPPARKWTDIQRENDRLKVEVDLLKMALEDERAARAET